MSGTVIDLAAVQKRRGEAKALTILRELVRLIDEAENDESVAAKNGCCVDFDYYPHRIEWANAMQKAHKLLAR